MSAFGVPSDERTNNPTVQAPYDEQVRLRKRVAVLEKPTNSPDGTGPVSQAQLTAAIGTRAPVGLSNVAVLDFPNLLAGATAQLTVGVVGAAVGSTVAVGAPSTVEAGLMWVGFVSAPDVVTVRVHNTTGVAVDPVSAAWKVSVIP